MSDAPRQLVIFSFAGEDYALPIGSVSEIIRFTPPRSVASDDPAVQGVIGLRGKIVPVIDLAGAASAVAGDDVEPGKIVIVENIAGQVGVVVDDVDEVRTIAPDQLETVPTTGATIAKLDDRLVLLLEPDELLVPA